MCDDRDKYSAARLIGRQVERTGEEREREQEIEGEKEQFRKAHGEGARGTCRSYARASDSTHGGTRLFSRNVI